MSVQPIALRPAPVVTASEAAGHARRLRAGLAASRARPLARAISILNEASARLADRQARAALAAHLAPVIHHDVALVHEEMAIVAAMLAAPNLERIVRAELGDAHGLDGWNTAGEVLLRRQSHGVLLHNLAGNALIVAPQSIALGLITKNVNLVKVSSDEPWFAAAFAGLLYEIEPGLQDELAICSWPGSEQAVYQAVMPEIDAALHWGGEESRRSIAILAAEHDVKLVTHGPKLSFGLLQGVTPQELPAIADGLARDVVLWEQRACASPRFIAVLPGNSVGAEDVARALADALAATERRWPIATGDRGRGARHAALRQRYMIELELDGRGRLFDAGPLSTVILSDRFPPAHGIDNAMDRLVWVTAVSSAEEVLTGLDAISPNVSRLLQVMVQHGADDHLLDEIAARGVARIEPPGGASSPAPGASHDGFHDLAVLTRLHTRSRPALRPQ